MLVLLVLGQAGGAKLAAVAGLLVAAPLCLRQVWVEVVDPDGAVAQGAGYALGAAGVGSVDGASEAVLGVVGDLDGLLLGGEGLDGHGRAEGLVVDTVHLAGCAIDNGRQVVHTSAQVGGAGAVLAVGVFAGGGAATGEDLGTLLARLVHVGGDLLAVLGGDERAGLRLLIGRAADLDLIGALYQGVDEFIVQGLFHDDAGSCGADLAGVEEGAIEGVVHGDVEVGIGEDDVRVLATELERGALDGLSRILGDDLAGDQAAGEGDHVHVRVLGQRVAAVSASAGDEVAHAVRQAAFLEGGHEQHGGVRGELRLLEDEGIAGSQGRADLPGDLQQRVVPRGNQSADANGLGVDARAQVGILRVDYAAGLVLGQGAEVLEGVGDVIHIAQGFLVALAGIGGFGLSEKLLVLTDEIGHVDDELAAFGGRGIGPLAVIKGFTGNLDGALGVLVGCLGDEADGGAIGRANDGAGFAALGGFPLTVDKQGLWGAVGMYDLQQLGLGGVEQSVLGAQVKSNLSLIEVVVMASLAIFAPSALGLGAIGDIGIARLGLLHVEEGQVTLVEI